MLLPAERDDARHEVASGAARERFARAHDARVRVEHVARHLERERGSQDQRVPVSGRVAALERRAQAGRIRRGVAAAQVLERAFGKP